MYSSVTIIEALVAGSNPALADFKIKSKIDRCSLDKSL